MLGTCRSPTPVVADPAAPVGKRGVERHSSLANNVVVRNPPGQLNNSLGRIKHEIVRHGK
jgi:hypothetical protein